MTSKTLSLVIAAAIATVTAGTASAADPEILTRKIYVGDLDLSREAGARAALGRVKQAATYVCGGGTAEPMMWHSKAYRRCIQKASAEAVAQAQSPLVTALYEGRKPIEVAGK